METLDGELQNWQSLAWYYRALRGKLSGAGGGGYLALYRTSQLQEH